MELLHCLFSLSSFFVVVVVVFNPLSLLDVHKRKLTIRFHQRAFIQYIYNDGLLSLLLSVYCVCCYLLLSFNISATITHFSSISSHIVV